MYIEATHEIYYCIYRIEHIEYSHNFRLQKVFFNYGKYVQGGSTSMWMLYIFYSEDHGRGLRTGFCKI